MGNYAGPLLTDLKITGYLFTAYFKNYHDLEWDRLASCSVRISWCAGLADVVVDSAVSFYLLVFLNLPTLDK